MNSDTPLSTVTKTTKRTPDSLTKRKLRELLKDVVAFVDVRLEKRDASDCVATEMSKLGATVVEHFLPEVTHLVFFEGYRRSYKTALRRKIHIVAPHWISDSKANLCKQEESKYIPDMPPPKEEIPFFRKRKFKPMVEEIVAGTYVPVDNRDANYYAERLTHSAPRKANSQNGTPRGLRGTPKTGGVGRRTKKNIQNESQKSLTRPGTGDLRKWLNQLDLTNSDELGKVIAESLKAIKEKNRTDPYNLWVDSPATTVGGCDDDDDDEEEAYVPLFERCKAKLLAEQKIKPPRESESEMASEVTPPSSGSNNSPTTPGHQTLTDSRGHAQVLTENNDGDVSKEILGNKKRRTSLEQTRANKKLKRDETSDEPLLPNQRKNDGHPSRASTTVPSSVRTTTIPESGSTCQVKNNNKTEDDDELPTIQSLNIVTPKPSNRRRTLANFKVTTEESTSLKSSSKVSSRLRTPSAQPTRKSSRLSMRVQISLDRFLEPKEKNDSSSSKSGISNSNPDFTNTGSEVENSSGLVPSNDILALKENTCPLLPGKLASTNLHQWEKDFLKSTLENVGGFKMADRVEDARTVVVSGSARRTMKMLFGIALGCWIVSLDWVIESVKRGQWICVRDFEVAYFPAALESRKKRMELKEGSYSMNLFSGCNGIFVSSGCEPGKKEVELLITICGGRIVRSLRRAEVCVGEHLKRSIKNVDVKWVLDSVTSNKCLDLEPYLLI